MKNNPHPKPPAWAERFLRWYCDASLLEDLEGDLHERFTARTRSMSIFRAKLLYVWDVLVFLRPYTFRKDEHGVSFLFMCGNYFRTSYRSLLKNRLHTSLIIFGLTVSMSGFILIAMYVTDELKYDRHYDKAGRIYRVSTILHGETGDTHVAGVDGYLGQKLEESYPEVEQSVALLKLPGKTTVHYQHKSFLEGGFYRAERTYFNIFSHQWLAGDPTTALDGPKKIVLTETIANKYFDKEEALNKILKIGAEDHTVTGVIRDLPRHTDLKFQALLSTGHEYLVEDNFWCITFILFQKNKDVEILEAGLQEVSKEFWSSQVEGTGTTLSYYMEPLPEVHFGDQKLFDTPKSSKSNIYIFSVVALFILLIACINYSNLSLVHAARRNKEAAIRKIMGALPFQLMKQYLFESFIVCLVSFMLALGLTAIFLEPLNRLASKELSIDQFLNAPFLCLLFLIIVAISFVAGSYPAKLLSSAKPEHALKGHDRVIKKNRLRDGLIVFQFTASIALMICTKIVFDQLNVLIYSDPGFSKEQVLVIDIPRDQNLMQQMPSFKNALASLPFVRNSSLVGYNSLPTSSMDMDGYEVLHNGKDVTRIFNNISVDEDYINLLDIQLKEGRNFNSNDVEHNTGVILVNEKLAKDMGWQNPLGQVLFFGTDEHEIVGVVKDFNFNSLHNPIGPIVIHSATGFHEKLMIGLRHVDFQSINVLELAWRKHFSKTPFNIEFLDAYFNQQYRNEETMRNIMEYFAIFTLVIAALGLFGLVAISTDQRTKEFGIRKVLGARFLQIASLVLKEFMILILLAGFLSIPIAWWSMNEWLSEFSYKTTFDVTDFALPILLSMALAILPMAYHTIRASGINPVESIKCN